MVGYLKINTAGSKACKVRHLHLPSTHTDKQLCHGPLTSPVAVPSSPAMQKTASRMETTIPVSVDCHSHVRPLLALAIHILTNSACPSPAPVA